MALKSFDIIKQSLLKTYILTGISFLTIVNAIPGYCQEIKFNKNSSWDSLLSVSKASDKLIFVDVYTSWCGPCKKMDQEVFTDSKVAAKFNGEFIAFKLDAEKGNGPTLSKKYHVVSYPTYLFINGDGTLIYRANGSMPAPDFLREGANALNEKTEPVTLLRLDSLYISKRTDTAFLYTYLQRRTKLKQDNADLLDAYCGLLTPAQQSSPKTLQLIADNGAFSVRSLQIGKALSILLNNQQEIPALKNIESADTYISLAQQRTLNKAINLKDESLLDAVLKLNKKRNLDVFEDECSDMVKLKYFYGTKQYQRYVITANNYLDKKIMIIQDSTLGRKDKEVLRDVARSLQKELANKTEQEKIQELASYNHTQTIQLIRTVKDVCRQMLIFTKQKQQINNGVRWMKRCMYLAELDKNYYRFIYPDCLKLYASYLYKAGEKSKAIRYQAEALKLVSQKDIAESNEEILEYQKLLDDMKRGSSKRAAL